MSEWGRRIPVLAVSIALAASLWLYVRAQNALVVPQNFAVKLTATNLDANLIVTRIPQKINVEVKGLDQDLEQVDDELLARVSAIVDLSQASPGLNYYRVTIQPPTGTPLSWSPDGDGQVLVGVDVRERRDFEVQVVKLGLPPEGIQVGDVLLQPGRVVLEGPEAQVNLVGEVRATLDVSKVTAGQTYEARVEVFGRDKGPMPLVTSEPQTVTLRPIVASAPPSRSVLITPSWQGQIAFGAEIVGYSITPNQIQVQGRRETLTTLLTVKTQPIDLDGLRDSTVMTVPLVLPSGVEALDASGKIVDDPTVTVRLNVRQSASPNGSTTGGQ